MALPWLIGGAALLIGGAVAAAMSDDEKEESGSAYDDDDDYEDELREEIQSETNSFLRTQGELLNDILKGVTDEFDPKSYWDLDSDDISELKNIMDEGREQCIYENVRVMDRMTKTSLADATGQLSYRVSKIYLSRLYVTSDFDRMISQLEELQNERDDIAQILRSANKTLKSLDKSLGK